MDPSNTLSSTEKLLDTIRSDQTDSKNIFQNHDKPVQSGESIQKKIKHSIAAGVLIDDRSIALVLTGKSKPSSNKEMIKWAYIPIPDHLTRKSDRFPSFLKSSLSHFLGKYNKKADIWTSFDSKYVKLRNIVIPDVHESKIGNAALWGLKKEFDLDPESEIFGYDYIEHTQINGMNKINIVAFSGVKKQVKLLKQQFSTAGYTLNGITTHSFALQNYIANKSVQVSSAPIVFVNIDRYNSEISCLCDKGILLTRTIRTGSDSLVEELVSSHKQELEHSNPPDILSNILDRQGPEFGYIEHSCERLIGKVVRTGDYCSNTFTADEQVSKYLIFGETDNCQPFMEMAEENISSDIEIFNPFEDQNTNLGIQLPKGGKERNRVLPAAGVSLSSNEYTPNFLYTHLQKNIEAKYRKMNLIIAAICAVCLIICASIWGWFNTVETKETKQIEILDSKLKAYNPLMSKELLNESILQVQTNIDKKTKYAKDYVSLGVINEICSLTKNKIKLVSITVELVNDLPDSDKKSKKKVSKSRVQLNGIVKTEFTALESALTAYMIKLSDSPLFGEILLEEKKLDKQDNQDIIKFKTSMEIL